MKKYAKAFLRNNSLKNSLFLMMGTALAQFVPILFSPLLTRIYVPADFGNLAIFVALSVLLAMISSGLFEFGIVLPKEDVDAQNLVGLIALISIIFFAITMLLAFLGVHFFNLELFYFLVPFSIIFTVSLNVISYWYNRFRKYKLLNIVRVSQAVVIVAGSFIFSRFGSNGLIFGYVLGGAFAFVIWMFIFLKNFHSMSWPAMKHQFIIHQKFPKLMLPTSLMNNFSSYGPVFFIKKYYNSSTLGSYSMTSRVLTAPSSVISTAVGQIFFKDISESHQNNDFASIKKQFFNTTYILTAISLLFFLPLFFFGKELMLIIFGKNWQEAGEFMEIISISSIIKFVVSPLSIILVVLGKINKLAKWQTLYFFTTITIFIFGSFFSIKTLLWIYTGHEIVLYTIYYLLIYKIIQYE